MANVSKIKLNDETYNVKDAEARKPVDDELQRIQNEGSTQVSAIGLKGQEVLESIPEEYAALSGDVSALKSALQTKVDISPASVATGGYIGGDGTWKSSSSFIVKKYAVNSGDELYLDIAFPFASSGGVFQFQNNVSIPSNSNPYIIGSTYRTAFSGSLVVPTGATYLMVTVKSDATDNNIVQVVKPVNYELVNKVDAIENNQLFKYDDYGDDYVAATSSGFVYTKNGPIMQIDGERTGTVTIGVSLTTDTLVSINNVTTDPTFTNPHLLLKSGRKYLARIKFLSGSIENTGDSARSHDFKLCYYNGSVATSDVLRAIELAASQTVDTSTIPAITKIVEPEEDVQCGFLWACRGNLIATGFTMIFDIDDITELYESMTYGNDIIVGNTDATNKILASRWLRSTTATPLTMLWFSDIHRDKNALERIIKYKNYLSGLDALNETITTGDIVKGSSYEASGSTYFEKFWYNTPGTEDILIAVGNHDWYAQGSQPHGKISMSDVDQLYFSDSSNWGIVRENGKPYYYKDYDAQKIRLIVTDPAIQDEADETAWLVATLARAKELEYSVIVASHYIMLNSNTEIQSATIIDNDWTNNETREEQTITMNYDWTGSCDIVKCVTDFITDGGSFLCYIVGHWHWDILSYPTGHPEQLIITIAAATSDREQTKLTSNDLPRYADTRTQDAFNVLTFDAENKIVKCVRVGSNMNMYEQPRTAFAYDVANHQFLSVV